MSDSVLRWRSSLVLVREKIYNSINKKKKMKKEKKTDFIKVMMSLLGSDLESALKPDVDQLGNFKIGDKQERGSQLDIGN